MVDRFRVLILMASRAGGRGGRETAIEMVANGLARRGHTVGVTLVGPSRERGWEAKLPHLRVGPMPLDWEALKERPLATARFLAGVLRAQHPQVVLATEPAGGLLVRAAAGLAGLSAPVVVSWIHGNLAHVHHPWTLRFCDGHLAISVGIAEQLRRRLGSRAFVVNNPVDPPDRLCPRPGHGESPRFLFMGRLGAEKRVDRLLRALAGVRDQPWTLEIVGDGVLRTQLEEMAVTLGLAERISWRGWVDNGWSAVGAVSGLVLTSDHEGFPMVLIEAIMRGVPLIAMDCDFGPREVIQPGVNGWLVPFDDLDGFRHVIRGICRGDLALPLPEAVRSTAKDFSAAAVVDAIESAMYAIVEKKRCGRAATQPTG